MKKETVRELIQRLQKFNLDSPVSGMLSDGEEEEINIFESDGEVIVSLESRSFGNWATFIKEENENANRTE